MALKVVRRAAVQWPAEVPRAAQAPAACTHCLQDSKTERICHGGVIYYFLWGGASPTPNPSSPL